MKNLFLIGTALIMVFCLGLTLTELRSQTTRSNLKDFESIQRADRDFDKDVAAKGIDAWVSYFAEEGKMFRANGEIVQGKAAIREFMAPVFAKPGFSLRWEPIFADVAKSGELGYTYGTYTSRHTDQDGKKVTSTGKYVTIWKKQSDGTWKAVLDIGT